MAPVPAHSATMPATPTAPFRITLLPGDGIGPEIMAVAVAVLKQVGQQQNIAV